MERQLEKLRRRWLGVVVGWGTAVLLFYFWLRQLWQIESANRWLALTVPPLLYCLWVLWQGLPENKRVGETIVLPTELPLKKVSLSKKLPNLSLGDILSTTI